MAAITNIKSRRETTYEKAQRLCSEPHRFTVIRASGTDFWVGVVTGDHDRYAAFSLDPAFAERQGIDGGTIGCNCRAGRVAASRGRGPCSHALAAEEMRLRGKAE